MMILLRRKKQIKMPTRASNDQLKTKNQYLYWLFTEENAPSLSSSTFNYQKPQIGELSSTQNQKRKN